MNGSSSEAQDLMEWFCGSLKTRRVPQESVLRFRRCVRYTRRPFPVPNFLNCQKKESIACTEDNKRQKGRGPFLCSALKMHPVP